MFEDLLPHGGGRSPRCLRRVLAEVVDQPPLLDGDLTAQHENERRILVAGSAEVLAVLVDLERPAARQVVALGRGDVGEEVEVASLPHQSIHMLVLPLAWLQFEEDLVELAIVGVCHRAKGHRGARLGPERPLLAESRHGDGLAHGSAWRMVLGVAAEPPGDQAPVSFPMRSKVMKHVAKRRRGRTVALRLPFDFMVRLSRR